jgi:hypothetical protein
MCHNYYNRCAQKCKEHKISILIFCATNSLNSEQDTLSLLGTLALFRTNYKQNIIEYLRRFRQVLVM